MFYIQAKLLLRIFLLFYELFNSLKKKILGWEKRVTSNTRKFTQLYTGLSPFSHIYAHTHKKKNTAKLLVGKFGFYHKNPQLIRPFWEESALASQRWTKQHEFSPCKLTLCRVFFVGLFERCKQRKPLKTHVTHRI